MEIRDRVKSLIRVKARDLVPHDLNPRKHPDKQKSALLGVLSEIGYVDACLVRQLPDGRYGVIDGHLRAETTPDMEVPCLVCDLSDEEALKVLASFDAITGLATFDPGKLDILLPQATFAAPAVGDMFKAIAKQAGAEFGKPQEIVEDEVPEAPAVPVTQPGDLWICGRHRLLCGDATKPEDVAHCLNGCVPFLLVTDPPYGTEYDPEWRLNAGLNKEHQTRAEGIVLNDDQVDWTLAYHYFPGHVAYVWHAGRHATQVALNLNAAEFEIRSQIIWRKASLVISRGHYHWQHEPAWYAVRSGGSAKWCGDRTQSTVWDIANMHRTQGNVDDGKTEHSTQKPVECMARPIRNHGGPEDDVYDPFAGSSTTMIACEALGRRCFLIELSPAYVQMGVERWQRYTGQIATLDGTGETLDDLKQSRASSEISAS